MFVTKCVLFCVFTINSLCKEIISISIDNDKLKDSSIESDERNILINIKNPSHESNIIPILSSSASLENYEKTGKQQSPWMQQNDEQEEELEDSKRKSDRLLNSIEETHQLWAETQRNNIYRANMRSELHSDNILQDPFNGRKAPPVMALTYPEEIALMDQRQSMLQEMVNNISAKIHSEEKPDKNIRLDSKDRKYAEKKSLCIENSRRKNAPKVAFSNNIKPPIRLKVARNSTIEVSDREYQANRTAEKFGESGSDIDDEAETLDDYPYSASVQRKGAHYTSGALVGVRWVLSTAAEFYHVRESIRFFRIRLGSVDCKKNGILTPVKRIVLHPMFMPNYPNYDISLLMTSEPLELSSVVKPIGLSRLSGDSTFGKFVSNYWPRIVVKDGVVPPTAKERVKHNSMRLSTQKLVPSDQCSKYMKSVNVTLDQNSLCLQPVKIHHSICMPDAGAPVVAVDGLWGITSGWVSAQCPSVLLPTVVTRVTSLAVRSWLEDQMRL